MSKTIKSSKAPSYDFWSRRCLGSKCNGHGKVAKLKTKRSERQRNKKMSYRIFKDIEDYDLRFKGE